MGALLSLIALALLALTTYALVGSPLPHISADLAAIRRSRRTR